MRLVLPLSALCLLLVGCGRDDGPASAQPAARVPAPEPDPELAAMVKAGSELFYLNCATCHMADGSGIKGMVPPLGASARLRGDPGILIRQVLHGVGVDAMSVPPSAPGRPMVMTAFRDVLDDQEVAEVLTYARSKWGGVRTPVAVETVAAERGQ